MNIILRTHLTGLFFLFSPQVVRHYSPPDHVLLDTAISVYIRTLLMHFLSRRRRLMKGEEVAKIQHTRKTLRSSSPVNLVYSMEMVYLKKKKFARTLLGGACQASLLSA